MVVFMVVTPTPFRLYASWIANATPAGAFGVGNHTWDWHFHMASFEAQQLGGVRRSYRCTSSCRGSVCGFNRSQRRCDSKTPTLRFRADFRPSAGNSSKKALAAAGRINEHSNTSSPRLSALMRCFKHGESRDKLELVGCQERFGDLPPVQRVGKKQNEAYEKAAFNGLSKSTLRKGLNDDHHAQVRCGRRQSRHKSNR
jgi:hypothetical protein